MNKISVFFAIAMFVIGCGVMMTGCQTNLKNDVANNMSDIRYNIYAGQTTGVYANLMCGMRENPYSYDGISNKKTEFGVISVDFDEKPSDEVHYTLTIGEQTLSGVLEENPYTHLYMTDIEKIVTEENVYITIENFADNVQLLPISKDWQVQYVEALEIGINALQTDLQKLYKNNNFCGECYLKIVLDQKEIANPYYWCFMFVGQDNSTKTVIFDVNSGEVLTQTQT